MPFIIGFLGNIVRVLFTRLSSWLLGLLSTLIPTLLSKITGFLSNTWKIALTLAAITAAIYAFSAAIDASAAKLMLSAPSEFVYIGQMLLPSNLSLCISLLIFVRLKSLIVFWIVRTLEKFERS